MGISSRMGVVFEHIDDVARVGNEKGSACGARFSLLYVSVRHPLEDLQPRAGKYASWQIFFRDIFMIPPIARMTISLNTILAAIVWLDNFKQLKAIRGK